MPNVDGVGMVAGVNTETSDALAKLATGTRKQFESGWVRIASGESYSFQHGMSEIPWLADVLASDTADGGSPEVAGSVSVTRTRNSVNVSNSGSSRYFQVRAL